MNAQQQMSEVIPSVPTNDKQQIQQVVEMPDAWRSFEIKTIQDCQAAADGLGDAKAKVKQLEDRRKLITKLLDDAKKSVMDLFRPATDALSQLERIIKPKIAKFHDDQEAVRRKAEAEAEERARKEREKLEAKAEKMRESGKAEQAEALEMQAATTVASAPAYEAPRVSGASVRKIWVAEVADPIALCRAIADGQIPPTVLEFKQAELNKIASTWQNTRELPGLKISQKSVVASR
jgi:hypothetical protein